jgi:O-acetyl-ADP-ribose deacetylase (regulator of RNase III)
VWRGGNNNEEYLLAQCYHNSLKLATDFNLKTIAFPNISTGVYGYPKDLAATIATAEVYKFLAASHGQLQVSFVAFDNENYSIYKEILNH